MHLCLLLIIAVATSLSSSQNHHNHRRNHCPQKSLPVREVIKKVYVKVPVRVLMPANELQALSSNTRNRKSSKGTGSRRRDGSKHHIYFHHQFADGPKRSTSEEKLLQKLAARLQNQPIDTWGMTETNDPLKTALIVLDPGTTGSRRSRNVPNIRNTKKKRSRKSESITDREQSLMKDDDEEFEDSENLQNLKNLQASESETEEVEEDDNIDDEFLTYLRNRKRGSNNNRKWQSRYNTYQQLQSSKKRPKKTGSDQKASKQAKFEEKMVKFILENTSLISSIVSKQNLARCMLQCASSLVHASAETSGTEPEAFSTDQNVLEALMNLGDGFGPQFGTSQNPFLVQNPLFKDSLPVQTSISSPNPSTSGSLSSSSVSSPTPTPNGESLYFTVQRTIKAPQAGHVFSSDPSPASGSGPSMPDLISGSAPPGPGLPDPSSLYSITNDSKPLYFMLGNDKNPPQNPPQNPQNPNPKDSVEQFISGPYPTVEDSVDFGLDSNRNSVLVPPSPPVIVTNTRKPPEMTQMSNIPLLPAASGPAISTSGFHYPPQPQQWPFYGVNSLSQIVSPPLSSLTRPEVNTGSVASGSSFQTPQASAESTSKRIRSQMRKLFDVNSLAILPKVSFGKERL